MPVQLRIDGRKVWRKSKRLLLMKRARDAEVKFLEEPQVDGSSITVDLGGGSVKDGRGKSTQQQGHSQRR